MIVPRYSTVIHALRKANVIVREIGNVGRVAVTPAAGRVIGFAFGEEDENLFWSNPDLENTEIVRLHPEKLVGGLGGDRLWFSPELQYNWDGTPDWMTLSNYHVPAEVDPGSYQIVEERADVVTLQAQGNLPVHGEDRRVGFEVTRKIEITESPIAHTESYFSSIEYVGIQTTHVLRIASDTRKGRIGLWHLLQVPASSVLIVPTKANIVGSDTVPLSYALPGDWEERSNHVSWRYGGRAQAKMGLPASKLVGRSAVLRCLHNDKWCMIVRDFHVDKALVYIDHPYGSPRTDQAFQAWDGLGFGEMEFHSPGLDAELGPREYTESDRLWAFGGSPQAITELGLRLLGVDIRYALS